MLTNEQNDRLTRVGPETPMGNLFRRYWHPVAPSAQLHEKPVKAVQLLGEDYVLFRDEKGRLGLVEPRCAHRQVELKLVTSRRRVFVALIMGGATVSLVNAPLSPPSRRKADSRIR